MNILEDAIIRRSLHDELADRLREMIVQGVLPPGEKFPEKRMTEQFGVSRTPLREALKVLAGEGLVKLTLNRGATVTAVTAEDLDEVFPVMAALEALSGELACQHITDREIARIRVLHEEMIEHYENSDLPNYFRSNEEIHEAILRAAKNPTLSALYRSVAGRVRRARYLANMSGGRWKNAVAEHEAILAALDQRDGKKLTRILRRHLENKLGAIRVWLQRNS
jgi:DNA-binding GntR family transcriptional regulator